MMKKWYIVHTQTGLEDKVKSKLEKSFSTPGLKDYIGQILIPTEQIAEIRHGKKSISKRKFFPGYILVELELNEETYLVVKNTSGVTGFIGMGKKPSPLGDKEVEEIKRKSVVSESKPAPKVIFAKGEAIRITNGPFVNFSGVIEEVSPDKGKLKASVSIFGRSTPVELEYWQVEKV
ncbi:MAG: transcription termination/antitermination protein NusG [Candidatus Omnitrophota bacterium]